MNDTETLIEARALRKVYPSSGGGPDVVALTAASFDLRRGEFGCVLGPSGSGKSTLLYLLGGLLTPTGGRLEVAGLDLMRASRGERVALRREHVGYVFPYGNLSPVLRLVENLELALSLRGRQAEARDEASALLARFGLGALARRFPQTLSSGEAQRAAVACALAGGRDLILADEPTAHLDTRAAMGVIDCLRRIHEEGDAALLFATHDERLMASSTRIFEIEDGLLRERER